MGQAKRNAALERQFQQKADKLKRLRERYDAMNAVRPTRGPRTIAELNAKPSFAPLEPTTRYGAYLQSEHWKLFRLSVIAKRGSRCEVCSTWLNRPQLHHLNYERLGLELETDVVVACDDCHRGYHGLPTLEAMKEQFLIGNRIEICPLRGAQSLQRPRVKRARGSGSRGRERVVGPHRRP
jgi:hypothetical protein